jgi:hypothetical protein
MAVAPVDVMAEAARTEKSAADPRLTEFAEALKCRNVAASVKPRPMLIRFAPFCKAARKNIFSIVCCPLLLIHISF